MENNRTNPINSPALGAVALAAVVCLVLCLQLCGTVWALSAAVFDFDDRGENPDELGRHIEQKLKKSFPDITVEHFSGLGDETRSIKIMTGIEKRGFDLAIVRTSDALIIAQHTLFRTPTLYTNVNNPLLLGFKTLGPPGGNISGASYYIPVKKHLEIYKALQPNLKKPGFIFDINNKSRKIEAPEAREACAELGLEFEIEFIKGTDDLRSAASNLIDRGADALICASSGTIYENIDSFLDIPHKKGIPLYSFYKTGAEQGAEAALSSDFFRMADELLLPMAVKVLRDKVSPGSMPPAFLKQNILYINPSRFKKLGLIFPKVNPEEYEISLVKGSDDQSPDDLDDD